MSSSLREMRTMRALRRRTLIALLAFAATAAQGASIDPRVSAQARATGDSDALLVMSDQAAPSLLPLDSNVEYRVRRHALVEALRARAEASQRDLRAWLDARGIAHRDFWIANAIQARLP